MAGARIPGPAGIGSNWTRPDEGTLALMLTPPPGPAPDATATPRAGAPAAPATPSPNASTQFRIDDAVKRLNDHAHASSQGQCARYVRLAIEAGGVTIPAPRPTYAKDYGPKLAALGFSKLDAAGYVPQKGDIVVLQPPAGQTAGHIQMHNGETWVSDFVQGTGIYPGPAYRKEKVAYEIYRP
ncbi:hypothetical protein OPU71_04110 [Niveibacterium sp. 24ML]|uniref:hypothetical protein n=1 Tax=Niveibacterium sp. 24ML TaxID=2985512 RepID=UPI002271B211|nr:hypothetical protein [Niveibacterium sp. 24ML]MCX9155301.1 hypothetical protein [Niveibacterium sp. 24ML]